MIILWIILSVVIVCGIAALRHYIKNYVFNWGNVLTPKTCKLFRETGIIYMECLSINCYRFKQPLLFLVDTGATTNFIREDILNEAYPQYKNEILYGDDVMSVNGTMTLNSIVNVPIVFKPTLACQIPFTILTCTDPLDYLSDEAKEPVVGIVGTEFLKTYCININFKLL